MIKRIHVEKAKFNQHILKFLFLGKYSINNNNINIYKLHQLTGFRLNKIEDYCQHLIIHKILLQYDEFDYELNSEILGELKVYLEITPALCTEMCNRYGSFDITEMWQHATHNKLKFTDRELTEYLKSYTNMPAAWVAGFLTSKKILKLTSHYRFTKYPFISFKTMFMTDKRVISEPICLY